MMKCPCGRPRPFERCCGPIIDRTQTAATAEDLMRSRYAAFATSNQEYLLWSWAPEHRPSELDVADGRVWTGLTVLKTTAGSAFDATGLVQFVATFRDGETPGSQTETSTFRRHDGRWVYETGS